MSVLVTGCAGFIGSQLCERLLGMGERVIGIDCFTDYYDIKFKKANLINLMHHDQFTFYELVLTDQALPNVLSEVDAVFHTAGQPGVRGSWGHQFELYLKNNIQATQYLLECIKGLDQKIKVIYSSSSSVYGNTQYLPTKESSLPQPYSPYGTTKLAAEHLCMLYTSNYGVETVSLRYFTVYGPRQRPDMAFHIFMKSILKNEPIRILGDGSQTRDFTFVDDIVTANIKAWQSVCSGEVFNIGGGCRITLNGVIEMFEEIVGESINIDRAPVIKGDVKDTWADTSKAQKLLDFQPSVTLREGLEKEWQWAKNVYGQA